MDSVLVELEVLKNTDIINSKEMLKMIKRLQELSAVNGELGNDLELSYQQIRSLEQHRDRLIHESEIRARQGDLSMQQEMEQDLEQDVESLDANMPPVLDHIKLETHSQREEIDMF